MENKLSEIGSPNGPVNVQDKELLIVGNLINCNREIKRFLNESSVGKNRKSRYIKLFESIQSNKFDIYGYNLMNLYSKVSDVNILNLNEDQIIAGSNIYRNSRNNYYSYFKKLYEFLNSYEPTIMQSLNEAVSVKVPTKTDTENSKDSKDSKDSKNSKDKEKSKILGPNPIQLNITTFKTELKRIIDKLEQQNDIQNYSLQILSIKTFTKQPIFVNGYNLVNNVALMKELYEKFKITNETLLAVAYNRLNKQILFVTKNLQNLVVYDITKDLLDYYRNINEGANVGSKILSGDTYLQELKTLTNSNAIIELYLNFVSIDVSQYPDNLYHDAAYIRFRQNLVVKQPQNLFK